MGASLAKVVASQIWGAVPGVTPQARMLLIIMALTAKDAGEPPIYFGGRDSLVLSLLGNLAPEGPQRDEQYRYISKLLRPLKACGAVRQTNIAHRGSRRATYALDVMAPAADVVNPSTLAQGADVVKSATSDVVNPSTLPSADVVKPSTLDVVNLTSPRKSQEQEEEQDLAEDPTSLLPSTYVHARAKYAPRAAEAPR